MLTRHWRWAIRLFRERRWAPVGAVIRSPDYEAMLSARTELKPVPVERWMQTIVVNPTEPTRRIVTPLEERSEDSPHSVFKLAALERQVRRGLAYSGDAPLLVYGFDCPREREAFGLAGTLAHLVAGREFQAARTRSRWRQPVDGLDAWLALVALRARHGDEDATAVAKSIALACEKLLEKASREFLRGVGAHGNRAA